MYFPPNHSRNTSFFDDKVDSDDDEVAKHGDGIGSQSSLAGGTQSASSSRNEEVQTSSAMSRSRGACPCPGPGVSVDNLISGISSGSGASDFPSRLSIFDGMASSQQFSQPTIQASIEPSSRRSSHIVQPTKGNGGGCLAQMVSSHKTNFYMQEHQHGPHNAHANYVDPCDHSSDARFSGQLTSSQSQAYPNYSKRGSPRNGPDSRNSGESLIDSSNRGAIIDSSRRSNGRFSSSYFYSGLDIFSQRPAHSSSGYGEIMPYTHVRQNPQQERQQVPSFSSRNGFYPSQSNKRQGSWFVSGIQFLVVTLLLASILFSGMNIIKLEYKGVEEVRKRKDNRRILPSKKFRYNFDPRKEESMRQLEVEASVTASRRPETTGLTVDDTKVPPEFQSMANFGETINQNDVPVVSEHTCFRGLM
jgi:hypothetical protein